MHLSEIPLSLLRCSEGHDRTELTLPGKQLQLLQAVRNATAEKTPFIVVLMAGGPVDISWAKVGRAHSVVVCIYIYKIIYI